jgi:hypothetical protein
LVNRLTLREAADVTRTNLRSLLLATLLVMLFAGLALAEEGTQASKGKQIMMVFTTDDNGELNPCG